MEKKSPRRLFLRNAVIATTGVTLLPSSLLYGLSTEKSLFKGYNPYAENKTDLRTSFLFEKAVTIKGTLYDHTGQIPVPNATIEVWHLSPNSSKYRNRGKLTTDDFGNYQFITDFPNKEPGMNARIYFRVSKGDRFYFTELSMNDHGAHISEKHWDQHQALGERLFPKQELFLDQVKITFDLTI